jgi:Protein of unknown function (Hypoth_ymh)
MQTQTAAAASISPQEYRYRTSELASLDFEDATARLGGFVEWLETDERTAAVLNELRSRSIQPLLTAAGYQNPPKAKTPEDVAAIGLWIIDQAVTRETDMFQIGYQIGVHSSSSRVQDSQDEIMRRYVRPLLKYLDIRVFATPDTSFVKQLTPLADLTSFDDSLKKRCLPILGAGAADPMLWDSAVRTAGVVLEERLRDIGKITDVTLIGRDLVNRVFGQSGTLSGKFSVPAEREGYRDLFAGVVGMIRNPSAHRFIDPTPEEGGATLVFVNLLLKKLELLR